MTNSEASRIGGVPERHFIARATRLSFLRRVRAGSLAALMAAIAGCQAARPGVEREIGEATGIGNAIVFRHKAEPVDRVVADGGTTLLPEEALRRAVMRDPRIQAALARVRVAEADANQSRLLPNPILNIDVRVPHEPGSNTAFEATLTGDLVSLLQKPAQISAADKRLRGSAADALVVALDVMSEAQQAYVAAQAADAQLDNAQRRQKLLQQMRDIAKKRLDLGDGTRLDWLTLEAQATSAAIDFADLQQGQFEARLGLAKLMGEPRGTADWTLVPWEAPPEIAAAGEGAWIDAALKHRPEIESKLWELAAMGDDLTAAAFSPFVGGEAGVHTERDPEWRTGPTITTPLPVFDWGQASRAKIEAQRIAARHELAGEQADVIEEVRVAHAGYLRAQAALADAQKKLVPLQQQQLDLAKLAYQSGDADLATLLLAETDLQLTLSKIIDLQAKVTVARVKLQRAAGGAAVAQSLGTQPAETTQPAMPPATTSQPATGAAS